MYDCRIRKLLHNAARDKKLWPEGYKKEGRSRPHDLLDTCLMVSDLALPSDGRVSQCCLTVCTHDSNHGNRGFQAGAECSV